MRAREAGACKHQARTPVRQPPRVRHPRPSCTHRATYIDVSSKLDPPSVYGENRGAPRGVGQADGDVAIEAAGAREGGIERLCAIRRREDQDLRAIDLAAAKAVHLRKQLIQHTV